MSRIEDMLERLKQPDAQEIVTHQLEAQREKWRAYYQEHTKGKARPAHQRDQRRWQDMKNRQLFKGQPCQKCASYDNLEVSHKIPLFAGGSDDKTNLQWLCHTHHIRYDQFSYS